MKQYVLHTNDGTIHSLVTIDAPEGFGMMPVLKPGMHFTEIETIKFKANTPNVEEFAKIVKTHKILISKQPSKVVKKEK